MKGGGANCLPYYGHMVEADKETTRGVSGTQIKGHDHSCYQQLYGVSVATTRSA